MAITSSDIVKRMSVVAAAGDTTASSPAASLGDQVSTSVITTAILDNLFDDVSVAQSAAGDTDYRCLFLLNNHATLTLQAATVSVLSQTSGGASVSIALDNIGPVAKGSASPQAATIGAEGSAPAGVGAFGAGPLTIGDMAPGQVKAVWVRRITAPGAGPVTPDGTVLRVSGGTNA